MSLSPQPLPHSGTLLLGWGVAYSLLGLRDTLAYLSSASGAYRQLTLLTGATAVLSTACCLIGMLVLPDARGAMLGIVAGEAGALLGMLWLVRRNNLSTKEINRVGTASRA